MPPRAFAALVAVAGVLALTGTGPAYAAGTDVTPPSVPVGLDANGVSESSLTLSWDPSTDDAGVAGYHVRWVVGDVVTGRHTAQNRVALTGLSKWNTYEFWVHAIDTAGNRSAGSDTFRITMPAGDRTAPSDPGPAAASEVTDTAATLMWGASVDEGGIRVYEIFRLTGDTGTLYATVPKQRGSGTAWRLTGLTPATDYTFAVRARDNAGHTSGFSPSYTLTTLAAPG